MSENTELPRDDQTGRPILPTDDLTGRAYENAKAGFTTKQDESPAEITYADDIAGLKDAAADRAASQEAAPLELTVHELREMSGERLDLTEAVSLEQASKDLALSRNGISKFAEGVDFSVLADEVDKARAKVIAKDSKVAEHLGVEMPAKEDANGDPAAMRDGVRADNNAADADALDQMEGLTPETRAALRVPQIRHEIERQFNEIDETKQSYVAGVVQAQQFAQASFLESFPEIAHLPPDQIGNGLAQLAQTNPQRFNAAMGLLNRVQTLQAAQDQEQQLQAQVKHQQFEAWRKEYSRAADAALGPMTMVEKAELVEDLVSYLGEHGVSRQQFAAEAETNLVLHHPAFQKMAADAMKYQRMVKAPRSVPQGLPSVQRPGVGRDAPRVSDHSAKITSLQKQLSTASGPKAARIAGQIRSLKGRS